MFSHPTESLAHLQSRDAGKHHVGERLSHGHTSASCRTHQAFNWLLADGGGGSPQAKRRQGNDSHVSQWGVKGADALLLGN